MEVSVSGSGRRSAALVGPLEGWRAASKGLGPLPRRRGDALAHCCGKGGRVVLPLARAAAVSTGSRVRELVVPAVHGGAVPVTGVEQLVDDGLLQHPEARRGNASDRVHRRHRSKHGTRSNRQSDGCRDEAGGRVREERGHCVGTRGRDVKIDALAQPCGNAWGVSLKLAQVQQGPPAAGSYVAQRVVAFLEAGRRRECRRAWASRRRVQTRRRWLQWDEHHGMSERQLSRTERAPTHRCRLNLPTRRVHAGGYARYTRSYCTSEVARP